MARLTSPSGAVVSVDDDKVEGLLARGFTAEETVKPAARKTAAKKSTDDE